MTTEFIIDQTFTFSSWSAGFHFRVWEKLPDFYSLLSRRSLQRWSEEASPRRRPRGPSRSCHICFPTSASLCFILFPKENLTNAAHGACKTHVCVLISTTTYTCRIYTRETSTGPESADHVAWGAAARRDVSVWEGRRCQECLQGSEGADGRPGTKKTTAETAGGRWRC